MKLLYFDDYKLGVVKGNNVVDVSAVVRDISHTGPGDLINGLIERFAQYRGRLEDAAASGQGVPVSSVRIRPPLPKPANIDAMAVNYMEDGTRKEPAPINAFNQSASAVIGVWRRSLGLSIAMTPDQNVVLDSIARCSTSGPRASAGKKVRPPTMRITPTTRPTNRAPVVGNVPAEGGTRFFAASAPAIAMAGMIIQKRPTSIAAAPVRL